MFLDILISQRQISQRQLNDKVMSSSSPSSTGRSNLKLPALTLKLLLASPFPTPPFPLILLRAVLLCPVNHHLRDCMANREPSVEIAAKMYACPQTRIRSLLRLRSENGRVARKQVREHFRKRGADGHMRRRVARMIGRWKERCHGRVELNGADCPVEELRFPAGHRCIVESDAHQRIDAGGARRIRVQAILKDFLTRRINPNLGRVPLPEKRRAVGIKGAREVFHFH